MSIKIIVEIESCLKCEHSELSRAHHKDGVSQGMACFKVKQFLPPRHVCEQEGYIAPWCPLRAKEMPDVVAEVEGLVQEARSARGLVSCKGGEYEIGAALSCLNIMIHKLAELAEKLKEMGGPR